MSRGHRPRGAGGSSGNARAPGDRHHRSCYRVWTIATGAAGNRQSGPAAAPGRRDRAAPTPGGPGLQRRTSSKVFCCSSRSRPGTRSGSGSPEHEPRPRRGGGEAGVPASRLGLAARSLRQSETPVPAIPARPSPSAG